MEKEQQTISEIKVGFIRFVKENDEYVYDKERGISTGWSSPEDKTNQNLEEEKVSDKDLYAQGNEYFVFIENGTAYYKYSTKYGEFQADSSLKNIIKLDENIKRVKIFNLGSDISDTVFLILEDGTVKECVRDRDNKTNIVSEFELFKDYKIEDILSIDGTYAPGDNVEVKYEILLKDGTTKTIIDKVN